MGGTGLAGRQGSIGVVGYGTDLHAQLIVQEVAGLAGVAVDVGVLGTLQASSGGAGQTVETGGVEGVARRAELQALSLHE